METAATIQTIQDPGLFIQWCVGILVVSLYAHDRFEKPCSVRWTTTFARYWVARSGYMGALVLAYLVLGGAFTDAGPLLKFFAAQSGADYPKTSDALPGPLFAALVLTSLLPHIQPLNFVDDAAKRLFQRIGNIPQEIRVLSDQLENTDLALPRDPSAHLLCTLQELGISESWLSHAEGSLTNKWARVGLLYAAAKRWDKSPVFEQYVKQREATFADMFLRVDKLRAKMRTNQQGVLEDELSPGAAAYRSVNKQLDEIYSALCDLIAGGLLQVGRSPKQRQLLLDELGFAVSEKQLRSPMSIHHIFLIGGTIFLVMLFLALISHQFVSPGHLPLNLRILFLVPITYCVSIVIAIFPKSTWSFANIQIAGQRPVMGYAASGALAAAAAFIIQLLFRFVQGGNLLAVFSKPGRFREAFETNLDRWPWFLMTFFTTVAIAWAADNYYAAREEPKWLRAAETAGMGLVFGVLQWITLELFRYLPEASRWDGRRVQMIATSMLVGACIGFLVPSGYRNGRRRERERDAAVPMPHPAPAPA